MDKMRAMSTPPTKVSFKEQMHLAREEAILQATCRLLGEKAYDAMTMDDVANAVGIAKASLYKHFSSKEELCSAAMVQILARVRTYLDGLAAEMPPVEKLQALVRWSLERLITNEMPLLPSRNSALAQALRACDAYQASMQEVHACILGWIVEAQAQGQLRRELPPDVILCALLARNADPMLGMLRDRGYADECIIDWAADTCLSGLASGPAMRVA